MDSDGPTGVFELQIRIGGLKMPKVKHTVPLKRFRITGTGKVR